MRKLLIAAVLAGAAAAAGGAALHHASAAPPKPQRSYVSVEVAGTCCISATWQIGNRPEQQVSWGAALNGLIVWKGWLLPGTTVKATAKQNSPIPPWLGPTGGWQNCQIFVQGVVESVSYYQAPSAQYIWGQPGACQVTV